MTHGTEPWSRGQWTIWVLPPVCGIVLAAVAVAWLAHWDPDRTSYWATQRDWFIALNHGLSAGPERFWSNLTLLGDASVLLLLLSPLLTWRPQAWAAMLGSAPAAGAISVTLKHLAAVPRPAGVLDPGKFTVIGHALGGHNSLPSGHSITVFAATLAVCATLLPRPRHGGEWLMLLAGLLLAVAVCVSRVAVGAHWPLDLLIGAAAGWLAGLSGAALARHYPNWWRWSGLTGTVVLLVSLPLTYRALIDPYDGPVLWPATACGILTSLWLLRSALASRRFASKTFPT